MSLSPSPPFPTACHRTFDPPVSFRSVLLASLKGNVARVKDNRVAAQKKWFSPCGQLVWRLRHSRGPRLVCLLGAGTCLRRVLVPKKYGVPRRMARHQADARADESGLRGAADTVVRAGGGGVAAATMRNPWRRALVHAEMAAPPADRALRPPTRWQRGRSRRVAQAPANLGELTAPASAAQRDGRRLLSAGHRAPGSRALRV